MLERLRRIQPRQWLVLILILAFIPRVATALWLGSTMEVLDAGGTHDQVSYDMLARRVATGHGFTFPVAWYPWIPPDTPTSYYSGTMVLHLAAIYKLFGYHPLIPRLLYAFLGTAIVYLVYRLGQRIFGRHAGLFAAACAAGYSYLILYSATLLTETPFIFFLLLSLLMAYRLIERPRTLGFVLFGLAVAGAVLFRMAVLPFVLFLLLWMFWQARRQRQPMHLWQLVIPLVVLVIAILPWTIRNDQLYARFMLLESQFGHVVWNSNHPEQGTNFRGPWIAPLPEDIATLNEVDKTNTLLRRGIQNIVADPGRFVLLTLSRVRYFFTFWPTADSSLISNIARVLSFGISLPFMLYGLILSVQKWRLVLPLYIFLIFHLGVYLVTWVMIRYRIPADTVLLIFAGLALATLADKFHAYQTQRRTRFAGQLM